jgi:N-acetylglucosaminyldiphosphoundecaprenol N-acetyl-beta-D-mannosaminyltransferase
MMLNRGYLQDLPVDYGPSRTILVQTITDWLTRPAQNRLVVTLNARMVMLALANPAFGQVIRQADLVVIDGYGVEQALKMRGYPAPIRVAGIDLVKELLTWSTDRDLTVFCYGGSVKTAERLNRAVRQRWPGIKLSGVYDGYGARMSRAQVEQELLRCQPQLLLAGLGSPTQELFLAQMLPRLTGAVGIGVGGSLEVLSGRRGEAPRWYRDHGWEWLFRMAQQPGKMVGMFDLIKFWRQFLHG